MLKRHLLSSIAGAALISQAASAAVIPVMEDSYFGTKATIARTSGKANSLIVTGGGAALVRFNVGDFSGLINPDQVTRVRAVFYIKSVQKTADLSVYPVTSEWSESFTALTTLAPTYNSTPLATIPAESVRAGQYVTVDITEQAKIWLRAPVRDMGLALAGDGITNLQIGSKEGVSTGHPAWLEIETKPLVTDDQVAAGVDAVKIGDGTVTNEEFGYLAGVVSPLQQQITTLTTTVTADSASKVSKAGDTMTGDLIVKGNVKVGPEGKSFVASGDENLRIIRGTLIRSFQDGPLEIKTGSGYTIQASGTDAVITFDTPFSAEPTVTVGYGVTLSGNNLTSAAVRNFPSANSVTVYCGLSAPGTTLHFIAIGPR